MIKNALNVIHRILMIYYSWCVLKCLADISEFCQPEKTYDILIFPLEKNALTTPLETVWPNTGRQFLAVAITMQMRLKNWWPKHDIFVGYNRSNFLQQSYIIMTLRCVFWNREDDQNRKQHIFFLPKLCIQFWSQKRKCLFWTIFKIMHPTINVWCFHFIVYV